MSDYIYTTNFGAKDTLPIGDADKVIRGAEFNVEFTAIENAIKTKVERPAGGVGNLTKVVAGVGGNSIVPSSITEAETVTLTGAQTLTNKVIENPTVQAGTFNSPTINAPTIVGGSYANQQLTTPSLDNPTFTGTPIYPGNSANVTKIALGVPENIAAIFRRVTTINFPVPNSEIHLSDYWESTVNLGETAYGEQAANVATHVAVVPTGAKYYIVHLNLLLEMSNGVTEPVKITHIFDNATVEVFTIPADSVNFRGFSVPISFARPLTAGDVGKPIDFAVDYRSSNGRLLGGTSMTVHFA